MFGAVWAQAEARKVLTAIGARVIDVELPVPTADEQFSDDGQLNDGEIERSLVDLIEEMAAAVAKREEALAAAA